MTQEGDLDNFGTVWYNPKLITNILSLVEVHKRFQATLDMVTGKSNCHPSNERDKDEVSVV